MGLRAAPHPRLPATAATIAGHVGELFGIMVNRKTINVWRHRGELHPVDHDEHGDPRYRIGDVLDRARRAGPRRAG